jgi:hypothetical protein
MPTITANRTTPVTLAAGYVLEGSGPGTAVIASGPNAGFWSLQAGDDWEIGPFVAAVTVEITATQAAITYNVVDGAAGQLTRAEAASVQALVSDDGIAAPTTNLAAAVGSAGALTGAYYYTQTFVTALGETAPWPGTATVVNPSAQRVNLTSIPTGPAGVIARRIYRTPAAPVDVKDYRFVAEINDNTTTTYTDNLADGSLGAPVNWNATNRGRFRDAAGTQFAEFSDQSTGLGQGVFGANVGYASTGIGFEALKANTTGRRNVAVGTYSLTALTTGYENTAIGVHSGDDLTTGIQNTLLGYSAGFSLSTQAGNTFVGHGAGSNAGLGGASANNVSVGRDALRGTASGVGQNNVAVGYFACRDINTADQVVGIGPWAGRYANASRQVFIDTADRSNIANSQNIGLIYGKGEATAAAQVLHLNAQVRIGAGDAPVVAGLPAASAALRGFTGFVTDASVAYTSANVGSTVAGGGANVARVFCNGTNWVIG